MLDSHSGEVMRRRLGAVVVMVPLSRILDECLCAGLFVDVVFVLRVVGGGVRCLRLGY
jgi:hypothetical protein